MRSIAASDWKKVAAAGLTPDSRGQNTARAQGGMRGIVVGGGHPRITRNPDKSQHLVFAVAATQRAKPPVIEGVHAHACAGAVELTPIRDIARQDDAHGLFDFPHENIARVQMQPCHADNAAYEVTQGWRGIDDAAQIVWLATHVSPPLFRFGARKFWPDARPVVGPQVAAAYLPARQCFEPGAQLHRELARTSAVRIHTRASDAQGVSNRQRPTGYVDRAPNCLKVGLLKHAPIMQVHIRKRQAELCGLTRDCGK
jgi:hypothetical protein